MPPLPASPIPRPPTPVWLDHLPPQLCTTLAEHLLSRSYHTVLNLSAVSPTQRLAVSAAFGGVLNLDYFESESIKSYDATWDTGQDHTLLETDYISLIQHVHQIELTGTQHFPCSLQRCLNASLTSLTIRDRPCSSRYLTAVSNLRELTLSNIRFHGLPRFLKRLSIPILDLQRLALRSARNVCLHDEFCAPNTLARWFPTVDTLALECGKCAGVDVPPLYLWHVIESFRQLRHVTLTEPVPPPAIARLQYMQSIALQDGNLLNLVHRLPHLVVSIATTRAWSANTRLMKQQGNQFERFLHCSRLHHLDCCINRGTEHSLINVIKNLRYLSIRYPNDQSKEDDLPHAQFLDLIQPRAHALLHAFKAAPYLTTVILAIPLPANTISDILIALGGDLEKFEAIIYSEHWNNDRIVYDVEENKQQLADLIKILTTAALNNPQLKTLDLRCNLVRLQAGDLVIEHVAQQSIFPLLPKFQATVSVLERRLPQLDVEPWKMLLRQFRASCSQRVSFSEDSE